MLKLFGLHKSKELMGQSQSSLPIQRVRLEEIPTWTKDFNENREKFTTYVGSADEQARKLYVVDWKMNSKLSLYEGDITGIKADGIVCCNSNSLQTSGGVSAAINQAAGSGLNEELAKLSGCKTGKAKTTAGYKLPAKYIVHTVGPKDGNQQLLDECYKSCLEQMKLKQMQSLVFCCISTGAYGYPNEEAAQVALKRVRLWLEELKKAHALDQVDRIVFCLFAPKDISAYKTWTQVYFPCGSEDSYKEWMLLQQKISSLQPLDGFIQITTTEPDMISYDDDPNSKRAKMPCGHVIGPESMTEYCIGILSEGKYVFPCPDPGCDAEWHYFLVRHVASLMPSEMQEFEKRILENFIKREEESAQRCPGCNMYCTRKDKSNNCVQCPFCSKKNGVNYFFCWKCLGTWKGGNNNICGNTRCPEIDSRVAILANCPNKLILNKFDAPSLRGCPKCGMLIEYLRNCTQMCCKGCGHFFCFLCLEGAKTKKELKCNPYNSTCTIAPRQTELSGM